MQLTRRRALALATSGVLVAAVRPDLVSASAILRAGGTGSATELLHVLGREFQMSRSSSFNVVPGLGSAGGIQATRDKALDLAVAARPLKPEEAKGDLVATRFARSPFVFATSHSKPGGLTVSQIARWIADPKSTWPDGTPVRAILRPRKESDTGLIERLFPDVAQAIEAARKRPDVPVAVSDQDCAEMGERNQGSLVTLSLSQIKLEQRNLRVIELNGVAPTLSNLESGTYPYGRDLYLVHALAPSADVKGFLDFVRSADGARVLRQNECLPMA